MMCSNKKLSTQCGEWGIWSKMKAKDLLLHTVKLVKLLYKMALMIIKVIPRAVGELRSWLLRRLHFSITFKITTFYGIFFSLILLFINLIVCAAMVGYLGIKA